MEDNAYMKTQTVKKPKAATLKKVQKAKPAKGKLKKSDPNYYSKIGQISAAARKLKSDYFSEMAKLSHAANNPKAKRNGYHGGRKPKVAPNNA